MNIFVIGILSMVQLSFILVFSILFVLRFKQYRKNDMDILNFISNQQTQISKLNELLSTSLKLQEKTFKDLSKKFKDPAKTQDDDSILNSLISEDLLEDVEFSGGYYIQNDNLKIIELQKPAARD